MADAKQTGFEVPAQLREGAERSVEQARNALDTFMGAARRAAETLERSADTAQASARDAAQRTFSSAEQNIHAALDLAARLVRAKDPQEAAQIQADFMRSQFKAMQAQMREFGATTQSALRPTNAATGTRSKSTETED